MDEQLHQILQQQMRDVHLPEAIGWWPLSWAWWMLIAFLLITLSALSYSLIKKVKRGQYRKRALRELDEHFKSWQSSQDSPEYLQTANQVLKRCVIKFMPEAAKLSGSAWADTLAQQSSYPLSKQTQEALAKSVYRANPTIDTPTLHAEITQWLKKHRGEFDNV